MQDQLNEAQVKCLLSFASRYLALDLNGPIGSREVRQLPELSDEETVEAQLRAFIPEGLFGGISIPYDIGLYGLVDCAVLWASLRLHDVVNPRSTKEPSKKSAVLRNLDGKYNVYPDFYVGLFARITGTELSAAAAALRRLTHVSF